MNTKPRTVFKLLIFVYSFLFAFRTTAQQSKIDSLQKLLLTQKEDTNKVNTLNLLGREMELTGDFDKGINYSQQALQLATVIASREERNGKQSLIQLAAKKAIAKAHNELGNCNREKGNYPDALKEHFAALKLREEIKDKKGISASLCNIGNIYTEQKDYPKALDYYFKALKMDEDLGDKNGITADLGNIGIVYKAQGAASTEASAKVELFSKALDYHFKALKMKEELGNKNGIANTLGNIGNVYTEQKDYPKALDYHFKALKMDDELGNKNGIAINLGNIGALYLKEKKLADAKTYINKSLSLAKQIGWREGCKGNYQELSSLDSMLGNYEGAYAHYKLYIIYRDSINNEESTKKQTQTEMQYEFDKKETQTKAEQDKRDAVAATESRKQKVILASVISGLALVLAFAGFVFRSLRITRRQKQLIETQKHLVEEKQREILDSIRYARRIQTALLPTESYIDKMLKRFIKN